MDGDEPTIEELASVYLKLRNAIQDKEAKFKEELAPFKEQFETVANALLTICNDQNLDSVRTPAGTVSRRVSSRYWTSDWEAMYEFIDEHKAPFLLEQRIHNKNMRDFLEENPDVLPMGLQANRKFTIQVRKPPTKE